MCVRGRAGRRFRDLACQGLTGLELVGPLLETGHGGVLTPRDSANAQIQAPSPESRLLTTDQHPLPRPLLPREDRSAVAEGRAVGQGPGSDPTVPGGRGPGQARGSWGVSTPGLTAGPQGELDETLSPSSWGHFSSPSSSTG